MTRRKKQVKFLLRTIITFQLIHWSNRWVLNYIGYLRFNITLLGTGNRKYSWSFVNVFLQIRDAFQIFSGEIFTNFERSTKLSSPSKVGSSDYNALVVLQPISWGYHGTHLNWVCSGTLSQPPSSYSSSWRIHPRFFSRLGNNQRSKEQSLNGRVGEEQFWCPSLLPMSLLFYFAIEHLKNKLFQILAHIRIFMINSLYSCHTKL